MLLNWRMMRGYRFMVWSCLILAILLLFIYFTSWDGTTKFHRMPFALNKTNQYASSMGHAPNGSQSKPRLNVIILTLMSSGSTFVGNVFNFHPDVFYLYEPLNILRRFVHGDSNNSLEWNVFDKEAEEKYRSDVFDLLRDCFTCDFKQEKMDYIFPRKLTRAKNYLAWRNGETTDFNKEVAIEACMSRKITVSKIMQTRLPGKSGIHALQQICSSEPEKFQCLIIHLVRDPRAVMSSLLNHKFYMMPKGRTRKLITIKNIPQEGREIIRGYSKIMCSQVEENLNHVNEEWSKWFKGRYILVRYEDTVKELLATVYKLYYFTGLPAAKSITKWIVEGTQPSGIENETPAFAVSQKDVNRISEWRTILDILQVSDFEEQCWALMYMMGYLFINGSEVVLRDANQTLYTDQMPFAFLSES